MKSLFTSAILFLVALSALAGETRKDSQGPYDPTADAHKEIAHAIKMAQEKDQHILLMFGANWCPWCRALHKLMESNAAINEYLKQNYQIVLVDVGRKDKNLDLNTRYGEPIKLGLPALVVLDRNGKQLVLQETGALETHDPAVKGHDPQKVMEFLEKWGPKGRAK
ncbi:MAG: thioredoxin family protein [Calditrichia bacterium]